QIGGNALSGLRCTKVAAILGFGDGDVARRKISEDRSHCHRSISARRDWGPYVFTNLSLQFKSLALGGLEDHGVSKTTVVAEQVYLTVNGIWAGGKLAFFVKLAVIGQVGLGRQSQYPTAINEHRAVKEPLIKPKRCAHN